jgi:hypothetical protein
MRMDVEVIQLGRDIVGVRVSTRTTSRLSGSYWLGQHLPSLTPARSNKFSCNGVFKEPESGSPGSQNGLLVGLEGAPRCFLRLAQAVIRAAHPRLRVKRQLLRLRHQNGKRQKKILCSII